MWVENMMRIREFLTNFVLFHLVMKHCVKCLIHVLLLKQNDFRKRNIIKDAKMSSFSSDFQTLIKHLFTCMFCCLYLQVILATNIAESSITVPDIKYGECRCTQQSYSSTATVCLNRALNVYRDKYLCKKRIVFIKSSLQLGQSFKTWISPFNWKLAHFP